MISVREATLALLRELRMTTVFGNPGSTELPLFDRWPDDFHYVLGLQESCVVGMADGFARASGRAAFCSLHSAVGVGHALGNIFNAYRNQTPLVIAAGQQSRSLLAGNPFLGADDAAAFPKPYVKWSCEPARAEDVPAAIAHAYYIAMQRPCGPTFVSIPADDWAVPTSMLAARTVSRAFTADAAALDALCAALAGARAPVLVAGSEIDADAAGEIMVTLAEAIGAPVYAAPFASAVTFPEEHALFAGFLPASPTEVSDMLERFDLVLVIGAPAFTFHVAGVCTLFERVALFQISGDAEALAAARGGVGIRGTLQATLTALRLRLPVARRSPPPGRTRVTAAAPKSGQPLSAEYVFHVLDSLRPADAIVVEEAPSHRPALQAQLPMRGYGSFYTMASGGLGYGLPAAVGVALAQPARRVLCIIGDGSTWYSPQALWSAVQQRIALTVIVINNGGYGALRSFARTLGVEGAPGIDLPGLSFAALAASVGCGYARADDEASLRSALADSFARPTPVMIDVAVDATVPTLYRRHADASK